MHTSLKFPSQKPNTQGSTCLTYQTGSPGGGGGIVPPTFGYSTQGCLTAVGNRCGHKKKIGHVAPPPPPAAHAYTKPNVSDRQHMPTKPNVSDRQHMPTKPNVSDRQHMPIREAAHPYKTHVSERQHMLTKPNISDRLKMTNTSQKPNIQGKLTMRTDLKCQHITRV